MIIIVALLLSCFPALAQFNFSDPSWVCQQTPPAGGEWSPTNNTDSIYPKAWWLASNYTTNGSMAEWIDRTTNSFALTNDTTAAFPSKISVSGKDAVSFSTSVSSYLRCQRMTNTQPTEIWILGRSTARNGVSYLVCNFWSTSPRIQSNSDSAINSNAGGNLNLAGLTAALQNGFFVQTIAHNSTASWGTTNDVLCVTGNAGGSALNGMVLNQRNDLGGSVNGYDIKAILVYSATNGITARSNIYQYLLTL